MLQRMCIVFALVTYSVIWGKFGPLEVTLVQDKKWELIKLLYFLLSETFRNDRFNYGSGPIYLNFYGKQKVFWTEWKRVLFI
jgi:hypothetical protein